MKNNKIVNLRAFYSGFMETDTVELFWSCRLIDYQMLKAFGFKKALLALREWMHWFFQEGL